LEPVKDIHEININNQQNIEKIRRGKKTKRRYLSMDYQICQSRKDLSLVLNQLWSNSNITEERLRLQLNITN
jgi:hypothetical protein